MIKVFIGDLDVDNVKNFKTFFRNIPNFRVVASSAEPGKDIAAIIRDHQPDLIIADIRFFGLSHYRVIRNTSEEYPGIRFIIYGNYNESEYMKKCLEFGTVDYMYKPVRPAELTRCLNSAAESFEREERKRQADQEVFNGYQTNKPMFERIFIGNLLNGMVKDSIEMDSAFRYFGVSTGKNYTVFIIRIDHFKKIIMTMDEQDKHILIYKILSSVKDVLNTYKTIEHIINNNSIAVIINDIDDHEELVELCNKLKDEIYSRTKIRVTIGIGRTYENPADVSISYKEADAAHRYRFYLGYNTVISIAFVEPMNNVTYRYPAEREDRLVYTAVIGEYDYCKTLLDELFDSLRKSEPLPDKYLPKIVMDILISINRYLTELNSRLKDEFTSFFPSKDVLELKDINSAYKYLDEKLKFFCGHIVKERQETDANIYESVKEHVATKYSEPFTLAKIAYNMKTTSDHINQIFIQRENKPLFEYLTNVRITMAKKLLRESLMNDEAISSMVGYDDVKYFKSLFKQYEGMTTENFRNLTPR